MRHFARSFFSARHFRARNTLSPLLWAGHFAGFPQRAWRLVFLPLRVFCTELLFCLPLLSVGSELLDVGIRHLWECHDIGSGQSDAIQWGTFTPEIIPL